MNESATNESQYPPLPSFRDDGLKACAELFREEADKIRPLTVIPGPLVENGILYLSVAIAETLLVAIDKLQVIVRDQAERLAKLEADDGVPF